MAAHDDIPAAILDVDGTLIDTSYQHVLAWSRALRAVGIEVPAWRIHRHIGMGGDQIVTALAGDEVEREHGDRIREIEAEHWRALICEVRPFPGVQELLAQLAAHGHRVVLASSAKDWEIEHYLAAIGGDEHLVGWTTSADVDATKPHPDVVAAAMGLAGVEHAFMVGDTIWDVEAATRAGIPAVGVLTGGIADAELRGAGALAVLTSVRELPAALAGGLLQPGSHPGPRALASGSV